MSVLLDACDTPYSCAGICTCSGILRFYLSKGEDPYARSDMGYTPFHRACRHGFVKYLQPFLELESFDINVKSTDGQEQYTPLHLAALYTRVDVTRVLISHGADINARSDVSGRTALHFAAEGPEDEDDRHSQVDTIELLLNAGADIEARTAHGGTPLVLAIKEGNLDAACHLLDRGASIGSLLHVITFVSLDDLYSVVKKCPLLFVGATFQMNLTEMAKDPEQIWEKSIEFDGLTREKQLKLSREPFRGPLHN